MKKLKEKIPHWNLRVILGKKTTNGLPDLPGVSAKELPEQPTKIKRKRMSRKKKIVLAVLIAAIIIAGFWFWMSYNRRRAMEAIRESASQVETVQVTRQNLIDSISVTGTIASADARDVSASASNVEVLEVNYDVGDYVNAGDVIVVLDSSSLEDSLEQAQNSQALSEYTENKSIETATENYNEAVEDGTDTYNMAVENEADAKEALQDAEAELSDTYMGENSALFSVADNENFVVSANVDEYDISSISEGMEAAVIVEALGEDELPATVSFVSPTVTTSSMGSSTYAIEIALDDVNTDLRIGMTAQASIVLEAAYDVLTVPYDCVETDEDGNSVVYVDQDGERIAVSVEVGMQGDYYVEVSGDGLDENTMVYYNTPLVNSEATDSGDDSGTAVTFTGGGGGGMPGGGGPGGGF